MQSTLCALFKVINNKVFSRSGSNLVNFIDVCFKRKYIQIWNPAGYENLSAQTMSFEKHLVLKYCKVY